MQDLIIDKYLEHAKVPITEEIRNLVKVLFEQNCELPEDVKQHRPSFLNFHKVMHWGGDVANGFISMLSAMNGKHGCFTSTYNFIKESLLIDSDGMTFNPNLKIIPGFGRPLGHGVDYRCEEIARAYFQSGLNRNIFRLKGQVIDFLNLSRGEKGKFSVIPYQESKGKIQDNLVFWNAAIAYSLGLSVHHASLIFILASQLTYVNSLKEEN